MANTVSITGESAESKSTQLQRGDSLNALESLRSHWPEYLMEAGELGLYMFLTCAFATLLRHPASPVQHLLVSAVTRRVAMGLVMGATTVAIIMSPWGKGSGGHFNPAITLAFYRLGKVEPWDALFYVIGQFLGGITGVGAASFVLQGAPADMSVRFAVTLPGTYGTVAAFAGELVISFTLMTVVLLVSNHERLARYMPYFSGGLIAIYLTFEAPLSGTSMNPSRSFGSALHAGYWHALWLYFVAPPLGMLAAAEVFVRVRRGVGPLCAKLYHVNDKRCIFHCDYGAHQAHSGAVRNPVQNTST